MHQQKVHVKTFQMAQESGELDEYSRNGSHSLAVIRTVVTSSLPTNRINRLFQTFRQWWHHDINASTKSTRQDLSNDAGIRGIGRILAKWQPFSCHCLNSSSHAMPQQHPNFSHYILINKTIHIAPPPQHDRKYKDLSNGAIMKQKARILTKLR